MKRISDIIRPSVLSIFLLINGITVWAQAGQADAINMADTMRSSGKIYVVVLIIAILFCGLLLYTIIIDRKVSRIEKEMRGQEENINKNL